MGECRQPAYQDKGGSSANEALDPTLSRAGPWISMALQCEALGGHLAGLMVAPPLPGGLSKPLTSVGNCCNADDHSR